MSKQAKSMSGTTLFENARLYSKQNEICKIENLVAKSCRKDRKRKSKLTIAQEIEVWKEICQFYNTCDVCELADMGVI